MKNIFNKIKGFFKKFFWLKTELMKMYSSQPSYFSKKRVESGIAFFIGQFGMMFFIFKKIDTMDMYEMSIWAAMEFLIAGYTVNQIQKEKKYKIDDDEHHYEDKKMLHD